MSRRTGGQRTTSTVSQQALYLLNNAMVRELSQHFAKETIRTATDPKLQVEFVYRTALGRPPSDEESNLSLVALTHLTARWRSHLAATDQDESLAPSLALESYCHTILNFAEFLYVD